MKFQEVSSTDASTSWCSPAASDHMCPVVDLSVLQQVLAKPGCVFDQCPNGRRTPWFLEFSHGG
eukprot:1001320-Pyramimonas_sp.AAC.1